MRPAAVLVAVLAVSCHAMRMVLAQSAAPNQQTGPKPLLGITVNQPLGEQIWPSPRVQGVLTGLIDAAAAIQITRDQSCMSFA